MSFNFKSKIYKETTEEPCAFSSRGEMEGEVEASWRTVLGLRTLQQMYSGGNELLRRGGCLCKCFEIILKIHPSKKSAAAEFLQDRPMPVSDKYKTLKLS